MTLKVLFSPLLAEQDRLLPGLSRVAEASFWVFLEDSPISAEELQSLTAAFEPNRGIIWHASGVSLSNLRKLARDQGKPFSKWPMLQKNLIAHTQTEYLLVPGKAYSGVAWIVPETISEVADLLVRTRGLDLSMAFVPRQAETVEAWANIVYGLEWLWRCQNWIATEPNPDLDSDAVLLSYIALTMKIGGAAGLVVENQDARQDDAKKALVFYAPHVLLAQVAAQLSANTIVVGAEEFRRWLTRGAKFNASP